MAKLKRNEENICKKVGARQLLLQTKKGGVGKATTTFNLGVVLAKQGKKVLIVDVDPQSNLQLMQVGIIMMKKLK